MYRVAGVGIAQDRVLLCREPYLPDWYMPGGRVHTSESSPDALRREYLEEVGVKPEVGRLIFVVDQMDSVERVIALLRAGFSPAEHLLSGVGRVFDRSQRIHHRRLFETLDADPLVRSVR